MPRPGAEATRRTSAEARRPKRWRTPVARRLKGTSKPEEQVVAVRGSGEGEADRHTDVGPRAHRDGDGGDPEVSDREVAVRYPPDISPSEVGRHRVAIHVRGPHIGDRGERHRVEAVDRHPLLEVDAPGLFESTQTALQGGDIGPRRDTAFGDGHAVGQVRAEVVALPPR